MKAVIIAGGKGTRLGGLSEKIPKPMVEIGDAPILEHQIRLLKRYGIIDITIITGYLSNVIEDYFKCGKKYGVNISYYKEEKPLGTTGGIKEIEDSLKEDFIVFYGDVMLDINIKKFCDFHKTKKSTCSLAVHPNDHPYDSDLVEIDNEKKVIAFYSKPHEKEKDYKNLVNAAAYIISPVFLKNIKKGEMADFGRDIFPKVFQNEKMYGYITAEYIKDVGTPERLKEVNEDYSTGKINRLNSEYKRKAIFLDRDGVINKEVNLLHKIADFELLPGVSNAIKKNNSSEFLTIVVTNQSVIARNLCSIDQLDEIHKKMETQLGREGAKLDAIYYCPHHPDKGYPEEIPEYKIKCECRKPNIGMIKKAAAEFNIDLKKSFIIGDSACDIICGKKAELTVIGVKTGNGWDEKTATPDYKFKDLSEAIDFIIGN